MKLRDIVFSQGFGTRYDCDQMIVAGAFSIRGAVADDPYEEIETEELVLEFRGELWPYCEHALIALNKPANYECSMKPSNYPSVLTLLPSQLRARNVQPVGRLDADTTGLLLLTDDGKLIHRLTHPKRHVDKVYAVTCKHPVTQEAMDKLLAGVVLADDPTPVRATVVTQVSPTVIHMTLTQGKYHQVKRMMAAVSNRVESLHRIQVGKYVMPDDLPEGKWCWIHPSDVL